MNETSAIPGWFIPLITLLAIAQTIFLGLIYACMNDWASKINRKLHRIESDAHHVSARATGKIS